MQGLKGMDSSNQIELTEEDITKLLIQWLRKPDHGDYGAYGYEVYLPALAATYQRKKHGHSSLNESQWFTQHSPLFYAAAWELCRRGILRPGITQHQRQATADGASGNGYSITPFGRQWLEEASSDDFVPTEPERFAQMLKPVSEKFGAGFQQRSQQAIRCYGAHAYLACCAMCGAAAESILLAAAIAKTNDKSDVLNKYRSAGGRKKVEDILLGQADAPLKEEFKGFNSLLKYWRDEASHGQVSIINENEAYTAIAMLLRFAMFVDGKWGEITRELQK